MIERANYLRRKVRSFKGGATKQRFLQLDWKLSVARCEVADSTAIRERIVQLEQQLLEQKTHHGHQRKRTAKHHSKRHERRIKKQRVDDCLSSLSWLESSGLTPVRLVTFNAETKETQTIVLNKELEKSLNLNHSESITEPEEDRIMMMLYVKDRFNISGKAYHEMASLCKEMPRHYKLKDKIAALNKHWNIRPTPDNTTGVQQSLEERLRICLRYLVSSVC